MLDKVKQSAGFIRVVEFSDTHIMNKYHCHAFPQLLIYKLSYIVISFPFFVFANCEIPCCIMRRYLLALVA